MNAGVWYEARLLIRLAPAHVWSRIDRDVRALEDRITNQEAVERSQFLAWLEPRARRSAAWRRGLETWRALEGELSSLPVPATTETDGAAVLTWSHPAVLLEIELDEDGYEWTARDRLNQVGASGLGGETPSPDLLEWARRARDD